MKVCQLSVVVVLYFLSCAGLALAQSTCPAPPRPAKLNFKYAETDTSYSNDRSIYALRDVVRLGHVIAGLHDRLLGLTSSRLNYNIEAQTWVVRSNAGFCVSLNEVDVKFGYQDMNVFVASEYQPQSCEHKAILEHENQHVAINRATVKEYLPNIRREFEVQMRLMRPNVARSAQSATDATVADLQKRVQPVFDDLQLLLAHRNAQIDTNMSYAAIIKRCENWESSTPSSAKDSEPRGDS